MNLTGLKIVLKLLQQSSLLSPSGQVVFWGGGARFGTFVSIILAKYNQ